VRFPQSFIDDLRRQADIVRVVSDYVSLKKKGANWMACCPFHQEKTPSFSVNPAKGIFYCFGCAKGGSVFNFVMELEGVPFPEAVRVVAEKSGVPLPALEDDRRFEARRKEADEVIELNAWALEFWEQQLQEKNAEAQAAREYVEGRGISEETSRTFRLGYAPNSWDALGAYLKGRGATIGQIERSGLVVRKETGGYYDRFRGRLIFPVMDAQGRAVAFGARAMRAGDEPKYLNSPETAAYTKGRHLFGLNVTRDEIRRKKFAILVEGYLDLIVPYQFGVRNVVASLGTALTKEQAISLSRFARRIVVNYDGDRAGVKAAKRALEVFEPLIKYGFELKVLVLPNNADPDEFIRMNGVEEYNKRRGDALPYIEFVIHEALRNCNLRNPKDKSEAVESVLPFIRFVPDRVQKREYFDMAMDALHVLEPKLREELRRSVLLPVDNQTADEVRKKIMRAEATAPTVAEQRLLELLIHDAELRRLVLPHLEVGDYEALPTAAIYAALIELESKGEPVEYSTLSELIGEDAVAADLLPLLLMSEPERAEGEATDQFLTEAESCLTTLRRMHVERRIKELAVEIAAAERAGDETRRNELVMRNLELMRLRTALMPTQTSVTPGDGRPTT
jgi:DNA primase